MKNHIKWLGVIALLAVIGLSFAACGGSEPEKTISVTGFPAEYLTATGYTITVSGAGKLVALYGNSHLSGSTVTFDLYIPVQTSQNSYNPGDDRWTGKGTFDVDLGAFIGGNWKSLGRARGIDIKNAVTTIPFSQFQ